MPCDQCEDLSAPFIIKNGADLSALIKAVLIKMKEETLIEDPQFVSGPQKVFQKPFSDLKYIAVYPYSMEYYFRCMECRQVFQLDCEILNGRGGKWAPYSEFALSHLRVV